MTPIEQLYDVCVQRGMPVLKSGASNDERAKRITNWLRLELSYASYWKALVGSLPPPTLLRHETPDDLIETLSGLQLEKELE